MPHYHLPTPLTIWQSWTLSSVEAEQHSQLRVKVRKPAPVLRRAHEESTKRGDDAQQGLPQHYLNG